MTEPNYKSFCSEVALLKFRAGNLGLYKTMHALEAAVTAVGYEVAEKLEKKGGKGLDHKWMLFKTAKGKSMWPYCTVCGVVQRTDLQNKPCTGPVKITLRSSSDTLGKKMKSKRDPKAKSHRWNGDCCMFCHLRRKMYQGPNGGVWLHYWSPYILGPVYEEYPDHPRDRKGAPPCARTRITLKENKNEQI